MHLAPNELQRPEDTEIEEGSWGWEGSTVWAAPATMAGGTYKDSKVEFPNYGMKESFFS